MVAAIPKRDPILTGYQPITCRDPPVVAGQQQFLILAGAQALNVNVPRGLVVDGDVSKSVHNIKGSVIGRHKVSGQLDQATLHRNLINNKFILTFIIINFDIRIEQGYITASTHPVHNFNKGFVGRRLAIAIIGLDNIGQTGIGQSQLSIGITTLH